MANEAREIATSRIVEWMEKRLCDKISCHQIAEEAVRRSFDAGYSAHESAIRTAAAALVEELRYVHETLIGHHGRCPGCQYCDSSAVTALKAALEAPTGKEME